MWLANVTSWQKEKKNPNLLPVCDVHGVDKKKFVVSIKSPADHPEKKTEIRYLT